MSTLYDTLRGPDYDPIPVEMWTWQGECLGKIGGFESMTFTTTGKPGQADTATLEVYLTELTAQLIPCDGNIVLAAKYNGITMLYAPVTAEVHSLDDDPSLAILTVQCSGAWSFLEGSIVTPGFDGEIASTPYNQFEITGALETVVKRLIGVGQRRTGTPVILLPTSGRGPRVSVKGSWETVGELVTEALTNSGYCLTFTGWVPGDPQLIDGVVFNKPCYFVDVKPHTPREGLIWSHLGGELAKWSVTHKRASATRAVVHNGAEEVAKREVLEVKGKEPPSPWSVREIYVKHEPEKDENMDPIRLHEDLEAAGVDKLAESGPAVEVTAAVEPAAGWEYGTDGKTPRQYTVGDIATVDLPILGEIKQVITDVEIKITPETITVTPTVGTPDTMDLSTFAALAGIDKRLTRLERKS